MPSLPLLRYQCNSTIASFPRSSRQRSLLRLGKRGATLPEAPSHKLDKTSQALQIKKTRGQYPYGW